MCECLKSLCVGEAVKLAEERQQPLTSLTHTDLQPLHPAFDEDVVNVWSFEGSVEAKSAFGGTSRVAVLKQCELFQTWLKEREDV